jgi:Flp pilus assembly pilin Flp
MNGLLQHMARLSRSEEGPTATEYAVLLGVIAVGVLSSMSLFGDHMNNIYTIVNNTISVF